MTLPTVTKAPQLPAYLANFGALGTELSTNITGGIKSSGHPSIGIKQAKWWLKEGASEELINSFTLDVIIVDANKFMSKIYYDVKYNPKNEEVVPPACYSDNGQGPSVGASKPQCPSCLACPHNVWGSRITEQGNKSKECADYKKIAMVMADDPERNVYELRIPPASLQDLNKIMTKLINSQIPIPAIVFQLSFDSEVEYPKIMFKPIGYVNEAQAIAIQKWIGSNEAKEAVGSADTSIKDDAVAKAVVGPESTKQAPEPVKEDPMAFLQDKEQQTKTEHKKRGRPTKAEPDKQRALDLPNGQAAAQATPIDPQKSDKALDDLLAGIMNDG